MTDRETALCNLATKRTLLRAFEPVSSPEFMEKLRALVEEDEVKVRKANWLDGPKPYRIEMLRTGGRGLRWVLSGPGVEKSFDTKEAAQAYADEKWPGSAWEGVKTNEPTERAPLLLGEDMAKIIEEGREGATKPYDHGYYSGVGEGWAGAQRALQALLTAGELLTKEEHERLLKRTRCTYQYTNGAGDMIVECRVNGRLKYWGTAPDKCPSCEGPVLKMAGAM